MEYLGSLAKRKVDAKRRMIWPAEWSNATDKNGFFFVKEGEYVRIYPYAKWKLVMDGMRTEHAKIIWSGKSSLVEHLDDIKRLLLPKTMKWKTIDLVGMIDYIIIRESAV